MKRREIQYFDDNGNTRVLKPTNTFWYNYYLQYGWELTDTRGAQKFQNRFRMSFHQFDLLLTTEINNSLAFSRWKIGRTDSTGDIRVVPHFLSFFWVHYVTLVGDSHLTTLKNAQPHAKKLIANSSMYSSSMEVHHCTTNMLQCQQHRWSQNAHGWDAFGRFPRMYW